MRSGKLDRVITIQRLGEVPDEFGRSAETWADVQTLRASLIQASTSEFFRDFGTSPETAIIFRTRFLDGVTTADRVSYEGKAHDIREVKEIGRRRGLEIRAVARATT